MIRVNDVNLTKFYLDMICLKFNKMQTVTRLKEIKLTKIAWMPRGLKTAGADTRF